MMFETVFKLKQHTPMLHFLHDQPGATLRATELKPKLDKFIFHKFAKLFPNETGLIQKLSLFSPESKGNAPFKISIQASGSVDKILVAALLSQEQISALGNVPFISNSPFFAVEEEVKKIFEKTGNKIKRNKNADKEFDELKLVEGWQDKMSKLGIFHRNIIRVTVSSFDADIMSIIDKVFPYFFAYENFGTRQNKGFGCFSVENTNIPFRELLAKVFPIRYVLSDQANEADPIKRQKEQLEWIQSDYKLMKSGRGAAEKKQGGYHKSLVFLFGVQLNSPVRWEKRRIKQEINNHKISSIGLKSDFPNTSIYNANGDQSWPDPQTFNYLYLRAMLGLSEQFEFLTDRGGNTKYQVSISNADIDRYKSPIIFKVHNDEIFLLAEEVNPDMFSKEFKFSYKIKPSDSEPSYLLDLSTPAAFSMRDFLDFALVTSNEKINGYQPF